ncbi:MAG: FAD:protein FMN transferase [Acidimicrobiaceae bacterium]|nr:FAD:protein FMN transferase [Acidimicrobiaceae bacterium]
MGVDHGAAATDRVDVEASEVLASSTAMASRIHVRVVLPESSTPDARAATVDVVQDAVLDVLAIFHDVERICTRFDPTSPLSLVNAQPSQWHVVPETLFEALLEAHAAYVWSAGRFDPRVLKDLLVLGYGSSLPFEVGDVVTGSPPHPPRIWSTAPWGFQHDRSIRSIQLDGAPVDLGGIGKGLAVKWACERLGRDSSSFLVEAGGDCYCAGSSPDGGAWRIGIEDPRGGSDAIAVLGVSDCAVATSSTRLRHWRAGTTPVHHLIDPRTGQPGGDGLRAVTVVDADPARAEVWTKVLFLEGVQGIGRAARDHGVKAFWIRDDGSFAFNSTIADSLLWTAS